VQKRISREEFEQANADFAADIFAVEEELRVLASRHDVADSFVRFAELQQMLGELRGRKKTTGSKFVVRGRFRRLAERKSFEPL
jgi:hypothetical protein